MLKIILCTALLVFLTPLYFKASSESLAADANTSTNVCLNQLDNRFPILGVGPSLYDPLTGKTSHLSGLAQVSEARAFSHFQIGNQIGVSLTTSRLLEENDSKLYYSQILYTQPEITQTNHEPDTGTKKVVSSTNLGNFQILIYENTSHEGHVYQFATVITHQSGATLKLSHERWGGIVHAAMDDNPDQLVIVGNFLSETSTVLSLSFIDNEIDTKELSSLKFQADRAYLDFQSSTILYWKDGLAPRIGQKYIHLTPTNSSISSKSLNTANTAIMVRLDADNFWMYNLISNKLEALNYSGVITDTALIEDNCENRHRADLQFGDKHLLIKPHHLEDSRQNLVVVLDGGPSLKQTIMSREKIILFDQGWSILASDYPGSWGYGTSHLNNISDQNYLSWAEELCKTIEQQRDDYQKITVRAHSFGAFPTAYLMSICDSNIDNYALTAPALGLKHYLTDEDIWNQTQFDPIIEKLIEQRFASLEETLRHIISTIDRSKVRIIIGENDDRIPINYVQKFAAELNVDFLILERMTHFITIALNKDYLSAAYGDF